MQFSEAAKRRVGVEAPTSEERELLLATMEEIYSGMPKASSDWFTEARFRKLLLDLDFSSTPGIPYMHEYPTIGKWLGWDGVSAFNEVQVRRLWHDVLLCYQGEWRHVFRCFVKDEPHSVAKAEVGRWRLIMCASLPMQVLWRMSLAHQNDWLNAHPFSTPSGHGLVFCYGGWRRFVSHARASGLRYSRDISGWDVNAPGWVFDCILELRKRFGGSPDWELTLDKLYDDAFVNSRIRFSNGLVLQQRYKGTMKSGLFVTIADNSLAMVLMHILASYRSGNPVGSVWCTGDDVLQSHISDAYVEELQKLGCRVKECVEELVFMGTNFESEPYPMYFSKHVVNFWTSEDNMDEKLDSYARLWCFHPFFFFWQRLAEIAGVPLRSRSYYQFWYSSPLARYLDLWD